MIAKSTTNNNKPTMYILAGPNGSGKSSVLEKEISEDIVKLNADRFSRAIAGERGIPYEEIQTEVDKSVPLQLAGLRRLSERIGDSIKGKELFSVETTLDTKSYKYHIKDAKLGGFEVILLYVGTETPEINILRVKHRVDTGKHDVPTNKIIKRYYGSLERLSDYIEMVDEAKIYDNSIAGKRARLILSIENGEIIKQNKPIPKWVNENINKKLYPDLYKEVLHDSKKEAIQSAHKELGQNGFTANAKPDATYEGKIISKNEYYAIQKLSEMSIIHELDKVPDLRDHDVGEYLSIEYGGGDTAKIKEKTIPEKNIDIDEKFEIKNLRGAKKMNTALSLQDMISVMSETENKQYKNFADMTKEEIEASLAIATKEAQQDLHDHGLPYVIGNSEGIYEIYPNGERIFKPYEK